MGMIEQQIIPDVYETIITRRSGEIMVTFPSDPKNEPIKINTKNKGWRIHTHQTWNRVIVRIDTDDPDKQILITAKRVVQRSGDEF